MLEVSEDARPRWGLGAWIVLAFAFAAGFVGFPLRVVGWHAEYLPGDDIDNPLNNFVLEHGYRYLTGHESSFWNIPSFYPQPLVTAWSDAHLGMLPVYAGLRAAGLSPERAFQGHFLISFPLNFLAAAWALRRLGFGSFGTAAGAFLFAFGLPLVPQLNHTQLLPRFLVPPAVTFGWEYLSAPRRSWRLAATAGCVVGQLYISVYIGYFLALLLATGFSLAAIRFGRQLPWKELVTPGWRMRRTRAFVGTVAAVALLPLLVGHARGVGHAPREPVRFLAPRPEVWLTPPVVAVAPSPRGEDGLREPVGEAQLAPGLATFIALAIGAAMVFRTHPLDTWRTRTWAVVAVAAWSSIVLALVATRFENLWLYAPLAHLPGVSGIRALGRVVLVLLFPMGIALAGCVDALVTAAGRIGKPLAIGVGVSALALVVADHWLAAPEGVHAEDWSRMRYPVEHILARQQRIAAAIQRHPAPKLLYVFPSSAEEKRLGELVVQLEAMRAAQDCGLPCVNGWSGSVPEHWRYFSDYRGLMEWLTIQHHTPEDILAGLVVVGTPIPDADPRYEATMRARFPPQVLDQ